MEIYFVEDKFHSHYPAKISRHAEVFLELTLAKTKILNAKKTDKVSLSWDISLFVLFCVCMCAPEFGISYNWECSLTPL